MMGMMKKVKMLSTLVVAVIHMAEYGNENDYKCRPAAISR